MKKQTPNRRNTLVVNKAIQNRIVLKVSLFPMLALLVGAFAMVIFASQIYAESAEAAVNLPSMSFFLFSVLAFVAVFGILLIRQAKIFSNKIAGPSYRICKSLQEFRAGDRELRIRLREGDFNTEIAAEVNLLLDWIRAKETGEAGEGQAIQVADQALDQAPSLVTPPAETPTES